MMIEVDEKVMLLVQNLCKALGDMESFVKAKMSGFKCHSVSKDDMRDIYVICQQLKKAVDALELTDKAFCALYKSVEKQFYGFDLYKVSVFLEEEILPLIAACEQEWKVNYLQVNTRKRDIKIKYVDFYGGFKPEEHWLYKVLEKRYNVILSETPDYLFFSCFGASYLLYKCVRVFISNEAVYPNLNLYDYAVTYSDFKITDRLLPNRDAFENLKHMQLARDMEAAEKLFSGKSGFCNFVYSNGYADPFREELFHALSRYKKVLAGGRFLNNIGYNVENLEEFQGKCKFSIACENSYYRGYTTEKLINALNAGTIPIYWGNPDISDIINPKAIINCHDYPDLESIVEEVRRLDCDDTAYKQKLMEPILTDSNMVKNYLQEREEFIYHIIEQPYAQVFRRNRGLRGQWYNDWLCHIKGYPNEWFTPEKGLFVK